MKTFFDLEKFFPGKVLPQRNTGISCQDAVQELNDSDSVSNCMEIARKFKNKKQLIIDHCFSEFRKKGMFLCDPKSFTDDNSWDRIHFGFLLQMLCLSSQSELKHLGLFEEQGIFTIDCISFYLEEECGISCDLSRSVALGCVVMCTHSRENLFLSSDPLTGSARAFMERELKMDLKQHYYGANDILFSHSDVIRSLKNPKAWRSTICVEKIKKMLVPLHLTESVTSSEDFVQLSKGD